MTRILVGCASLLLLALCACDIGEIRRYVALQHDLPEGAIIQTSDITFTDRLVTHRLVNGYIFREDRGFARESSQVISHRTLKPLRAGLIQLSSISSQ